jgi:type III secretion protein L
MAFITLLPINIHGSDEVFAEHGIVRAEHAQQVLHIVDIESRAALHIAELTASAEKAARELIAAAHVEVNQMLDLTRAQAAEALQQAYRQGNLLAVTEWHEQQLIAAKSKADKALQLHEKLADVVTTAVERIVQGEGRAALFKRALKSVQSLASGLTAITLRVNAIDENDATASIADLLHTHRPHQQMNVVVDSSLAPGSCIFESEAGVLDASLQIQLDALRAAMSRAVRQTIECEQQFEAAEAAEAAEKSTESTSPRVKNA